MEFQIGYVYISQKVYNYDKTRIQDVLNRVRVGITGRSRDNGITNVMKERAIPSDLTPMKATDFNEWAETFKYEIMQLPEVTFTGSIPICPYCKEPTVRSHGGASVTAMYFPPTYDENGVNTNPDRNIRTESYQCSKCNNCYSIVGNEHDGYIYRK